MLMIRHRDFPPLTLNPAARCRNNGNLYASIIAIDKNEYHLDSYEKRGNSYSIFIDSLFCVDFERKAGWPALALSLAMGGRQQPLSWGEPRVE